MYAVSIPHKRVSGGLTTYAYYNGFGGVKTEDIDTNGNDWLYGYQSSGGTADPWSRLRSKTDPLGNQGLMPHRDQSERFIRVQQQQLHSECHHNARRLRASDQRAEAAVAVFIELRHCEHVLQLLRRESNRIHVESCSTTSGSSCSTYGPTNTYDMLGRLVSSVQSGSNATGTNTYNENDVLTQLSPAPSGENIKQGQHITTAWAG